MNLAPYCSVADACAIAGVSKSYLYAMIATGRIKAQRIGRTYAVLRSSVAAFERQPGMGRPPKPLRPSQPARRPRPAKRKPRKK